jgi:hypothetical protein
VNTSVRDAVNLLPIAAAGTNATGILLRADSDLSQAFERIESDGGRSPGTLSRLSGELSRVDPTISFTIDMQGNLIATGTPDAGDFDAPVYLSELYRGNRLGLQSSLSTGSAYFYNTQTDYETLKIWRGINAPGADEAWVLVDCTFNLSWNFTAGEKSTLLVDVFANSVQYQSTATYPTNTGSTAYGNQVLAAPILQLAAATINSQVRGFVSASLGSTYPDIEVPDSNVSGGITNVIGQPRTVEFQASWYVEKGEYDYPMLENASSAVVPMEFTLGQAAGAGELANAWKFTIANLRVTDETKEDSDALRVLRSITGYATVSGGGTDNEELVLTAV